VREGGAVVTPPEAQDHALAFITERIEASSSLPMPRRALSSGRSGPAFEDERMRSLRDTFAEREEREELSRLNRENVIRLTLVAHRTSLPGEVIEALAEALRGFGS